MTTHTRLAHRSAFTTRTRLAHRSGFTLIELLVVITIIGVLVSLTVVGVAGAIQTAKQTKIKVEVDNLAAALEAYRAAYNSYPPTNLTNPTPAGNPALVAHVARRFPRYDITKLSTDLTTLGVSGTFNPHVALMFWLQGFSPDVTQPFTGGGQRTPLFDFDKSRVYTLGGAVATPNANGAYTVPVVYIASYGGAAYAYFDNQSYGTPASPTTFATTNLTSTTSTVVPYILDVNSNGTTGIANDTFAKPTSFQIISAGLDGMFSATSSPSAQRFYPTGINYDPNGNDDDNITNFCDRSKLGDAKP